MDLDRPSIEKRDFPLKRRGWDPDAVAAHLAALAEEVEVLRRSTDEPRPAESLATAASGQVRLIVEAAERSAEDLHREAGLERARILEDAHREAREHLERVAGSTVSMLERADALEQEFQALLTSVRTSATRLAHELRSLEGAVDELRAAPPPSAPVAAQPAPEPLATAPEPLAPAPEPLATAPEPLATADEEGVRLIALNMALSGTSREETERYLADQFEAVDLEGLLDDVYVRAGQ